MSESAQKELSTFYEKLGLLYDTQSELQNAYAAFLAWKENRTEYYERYITLDIVPTASSDSIMCFLTSVSLPVDGQIVQELRFGAAFDRNTGKVTSNWDLFALPEAEARQRLLDAFEVYAALRVEMEAALKPEYIIMFPENMEVTFPMGTLPSQEYEYRCSLDYNKLKAILQPWVIPETAL